MGKCKNAVIATGMAVVCALSGSSVEAAASSLRHGVRRSLADSGKCGGAVNAGAENCQPMLWGPTGDSAQHCYAYGGVNDPCALTVTNDADFGLNKDPSLCKGDTFYLWDEPNSHGKTLGWAGSNWRAYASKFSRQIAEMRTRAVQFTSPLMRADNIPGDVSDFYAACGSGCTEKGDAAYIDVIAANPFCGPWNISPPDSVWEEKCRVGATFVVSQLKLVPQIKAGVPVFLTNWGRQQVGTPEAQVAVIDSTDAFFAAGSPVQRVYYFTAIDFGGHTHNNFLTDVDSGSGLTLGELWQTKCASL